MADIDWLGRVRRIRQYSSGGKRAPHKPLLLLYALAQLQQDHTSMVPFETCEPKMKKLLTEFGPPSANVRAEYPFHHLQTDKLWEVVPAKDAEDFTSKPSASVLRDAEASGHLPARFVAALQEDDGPALFHLIASELLSSNWPESLHDEICESVNLHLDTVEIDMARARARAADETDTEVQRRRDPKFRELVLRAYELQCAICGWDGRLDASTVGLEAAHVKWWSSDGPDEIQNGLCLCSMHHRLFDKGAIGVSKDHRVAVSEHFFGRGPTAEALVLSRNGSELIRPQRSEYEPLPEYLDWHRAEVFRTPARPSSR